MTKKHYIKLAKALLEARPTVNRYQPEEAYQHSLGYLTGFERAIEIVADALQNERPEFDRSRFLTAAGVK